MKHAIMSLDPGGTTGVACFLFSNESDHPVECLTVYQLMATPLATDNNKYEPYERVAWQLMGLWEKFRLTARRHHQIHPDYHEIVSEDFNLRTKARDRDVLAPVYVSCVFQGIRMGTANTYEKQGLGPTHVPVMKWSSPSIRDAFPREGLTQAHLWIPGKDHAVSAIRHGLARARANGYAGVLSARKGKPDPFFP